MNSSAYCLLTGRYNTLAQVQVRKKYRVSEDFAAKKLRRENREKQIELDLYNRDLNLYRVKAGEYFDQLDKIVCAQCKEKLGSEPIVVTVSNGRFCSRGCAVSAGAVYYAKYPPPKIPSFIFEKLTSEKIV